MATGEQIKFGPVDVAIVGSGVGGAAFCARLASRAPRLRILCLERGGWLDRAKPAGAAGGLAARWRSARGRRRPISRLKAGGNALSADYPIDDAGSDFKPLMWNGVGGSTINWAAHFPRLHPSDFRTRTLDGVGDDWPFSYFDLEPYYDLNDEAMGVCGPGRRSRLSAEAESRRMPPLPLGRLGATAARGFDALGWHWWPVDAAINTVPRRRARRLQSLRPVPARLRHRREVLDRPHLLAAARSPAASSCAPAAWCRRSWSKAGVATGVRYRDGARPRLLPAGLRPSWWPATASARRGCCWRPASSRRRSAAT